MLRRPLVLLDVDGVLHDRDARDRIRMSADPAEVAAELGVAYVAASGRKLAIPHHMAGLVQHLVEVAEVWWCTTWRHRANDAIRHHLDVGELPVIDDGTRSVGLGWKVETAGPLIEEAIADARDVYWIEDFDGVYPGLDGVTYIDTARAGFLRPDDLPEQLRRE